MKTPSATAHPLVHEAAELGAMVNPFALQDWPKEKLRALIASCEALCDEAEDAIEEWYKGELFKPENFFRRASQKALDKARQDAHIQVVSITAPLNAAALFMLERKQS